MRFSSLFLCTFLVLFFAIIGNHTVLAAGTIPRDGLRLELMLATGAQDTSGNNRIVSATGVAPTYQLDPVYGVPYAQFGGSGGLKVNTAWTASGADDFTVSMWVKHGTGGFLSQSTSIVSQSTLAYETQAQTAGFGWSRGNTTEAIFRTYTTNLAQPLFINSDSTNGANNIRLLLTVNGKCIIRGDGNFAHQIDSVTGGYQTIYGYAWARHNITARDYATNTSEQFDCQKLLNNQWHHIVINKKSGVVNFYLDGISIYKATLPLNLSKELLVGYSNSFVRNKYFTNYPFHAGTGSIGMYWNGSFMAPGGPWPVSNPSYFTNDQINSIEGSHYARNALSTFRLYSRALSDTEIEALGDEYRYAQSDLIGADGIQVTMDKYVKPILYANFRNIPSNLNKDNVIYEYSTSTGVFLPITNITEIGSSSGSIDYKIGVDLSGKPDGKINVIFRVRSADQSFQNIGTVGFMKIDTQTEIIINQPNTDLNIDKTITASVTDGQLYLFQTRGTVCDGTITTWEDYSDLTFAGKSDNGIRICYKAIFSSVNKTIYKLSATIQGIQPKEQANLTSGLFSDYTLWSKSIYQKPNDSTSMILELLGVSASQSQGTINGITMTDINGDGLVDFLYSRNDTIRRAIIVNNGNYTFKTVYKCAYDVGIPSSFNNNTGLSTPAVPAYYYGDCADTTR